MQRTHSYVVISNNVDLQDQMAQAVKKIHSKNGTISHLSHSTAVSVQEGIMYNTVIILYTVEKEHIAMPNQEEKTETKLPAPAHNKGGNEQTSHKEAATVTTPATNKKDKPLKKAAVTGNKKLAPKKAAAKKK